MTKPTLLVTRRLPQAAEARAARDYDARLNPADVPRTGAGIAALAAGAHAILCCPAEKLDAAAIGALPGTVRVIGTFSVGYDHLDVPAAQARGIAVVNTPDVLSTATAECALLLLLAAARRAGEGERMLRRGAWSGWAPTQLLGTGVVGRPLGIFGMGRIGRELAALARGLNMPVHYRNRQPLPPGTGHGATYHDNDDSFLAASELLSLNAPGGPATLHWLNAERIAKLPRGAVVANAGRGTLVDDAAMVAALRRGHLAAYGADVYEGEPALHPGYLTLENTVLLPHLGSATATARDAMGMLVLDGIDAALAGRTPTNLVRA